MKTCTHEGCTTKHFCKGYCTKHYQRFKKYGRVISDEENRQKFKKQKGVRLNTGRTLFKKNHKSWNKGVAGWPSKEHIQAIIKANTGRPGWCKDMKLDYLTGSKNWIWAGDDVSYRTLHKWVERHLGKPGKCERCKKSGLKQHQIHWSNISGEYLRDLEDWQRLCAKCHKAYDKQLKVAGMRG